MEPDTPTLLLEKIDNEISHNGGLVNWQVRGYEGDTTSFLPGLQGTQIYLTFVILNNYMER